MGTNRMSRTLALHQYGDSWDYPVRTLLSLRAWAFWRASLGGWAVARDFCAREWARQAQQLEADLTGAHAGCGYPLLSSTKAEQLLKQWVSEIAERLAPKPS